MAPGTKIGIRGGDASMEEHMRLLPPDVARTVKLRKKEVSGNSLGTGILLDRGGSKRSSCASIGRQVVSKEGIVVVGATGTGKSSTTNIYTGSCEAVGHGTDSMTNKAVTVEDNNHPGDPVWVDSPGWLDGKGESDNLLFKELMRHLQKGKITSLKFVVWCVNGNSKEDAMLQAQACLIDKITLGEDTIWSNVLILCKGTEDCEGALEAAKKVNLKAQPLMISYLFAKLTVTDQMTQAKINQINKKQAMIDEWGPEQREIFKHLTEDEIKVKLESILRDPEVRSIPIPFQNMECRACGQKGDPRTMEDFCHQKLKMGHLYNEELKDKKRVSKAKIGAAYTAGIAGAAGVGTLAVMVPGSEAVLMAIPIVLSPGTAMSGMRLFAVPKKIYKCCGREEGAAGHIELCNNPECKSETGSLRGATQWGCPPPDDAKLCTDEKDKKWRPPGCVMITQPDLGMQKRYKNYKVMEKDHDLYPL
eukprot:GFUD01061932.1.p1 GENE.GFUD01061932.1~~GFUD01061932.1.p1  ORF type:complete len:476 (+),score=128.34 GFUD01061932.1:302-1729(+)